MCEERWQGEDDGTALICDGTAVLPMRPMRRRLYDAEEGRDAKNQTEDESGENGQGEEGHG